MFFFTQLYFLFYQQNQQLQLEFFLGGHRKGTVNLFALGCWQEAVNQKAVVQELVLVGRVSCSAFLISRKPHNASSISCFLFESQFNCAMPENAVLSCNSVTNQYI